MESVIKAGSRKLQTVVFGGVQISGEWECVRGSVSWRILFKEIHKGFRLIIRVFSAYSFLDSSYFRILLFRFFFFFSIRKCITFDISNHR